MTYNSITFIFEFYNSESDDIYPDSIRQDLGKSQEINV